MRCTRALIPLAAAILLNVPAAIWPVAAAADQANAPSLVISQLKITSSNGQFVTLYNATDSKVDMGRYQLEYFNNYDLGKATSSRLISLSGTVPPHGYYMVNDSSLLLCYQLTVDSLSLGFSSTAGFIELIGLNQSSSGQPVSSTVNDYVGWSKTAANGAQTLPTNTSAFLQRQPADSAHNPAISAPGTGSWQAVLPDSGNACNLVSSSSSPQPVQTGLNQLLPSSEPPATIVSLVPGEQSPTPPHLPAADIGLMAPSLSELLPNPAGTGNDKTDEFIELYNGNGVAFDLSGFVLQTGTKKLYKYTFPAGTKLVAKSFKAFYSRQTKLTLSNTGSQAKLLDPFGNSISTSDVFASAKDGNTWALAKGKWYWTTQPTPGAANVIKEPVSKSKKSSSTSSGSVASGAGSSGSKSKSSGFAGSDQPPTTPVHFGALAAVVGLALLYGIYEYRHDLANRIYQFRRYVAFRRGNRPGAEGWGVDRAEG